MTGTDLPRKRSEHGASLILLVGIIGLAFIVTVAAFLVAASNGQDTARLASAKVDIATREDALMREILQCTATGMLTGTPATWTTIMTSAVNQLRATTYVDPVELQTITGLTSGTNVTTANTADTGGTSLGIFQGYNQEVPYGGTGPLATLANLDPSYNSAVEPPLMTWSSASGALSPSTALTNPQEFFLGSQYSASNRWGQITYPNVRFGYKQPGNLFVARQVWWRIPVLYSTTQQIVQAQTSPTPIRRYPGVVANYVLSAYEIPSQLPISGNANLQIGLNADGTAWGSGIQVTGSIYGGQIALSPGTYAGVSSRQQVNVLSTATVGGVSYASGTGSAFDQPGTRETMALALPPGVAAPVSVAGNDGKVLLVPVMPGNQFYMSVATPTHWDLYARPYYRCRIRVIVSGTNANPVYNSTTGTFYSVPSNAGAITVKIYVLPDMASPSQPNQIQILGIADPATPTITYSQAYSGDTSNWPSPPSWMTYTSTTAGDRNLLVIDVGKMVSSPLVSSLGNQAQLYSIYIGSAGAATASDPGIAITNTNNLSAFTSGLSIVSNQTLYLLDSFNQFPPQPPTSIYAPQIRYGLSGLSASVTLTGQVSVDPASSATPQVNPLNLVNASGTTIPAGSIQASFIEITDPTKIPPIQRMSLMFTIEKERTN